MSPGEAGKPTLPRWARAAGMATAVLAMLVALPWEKQLDHSFAWDTSPVPDTGAQDRPSFVRSVLTIDSHGVALEAWLYLPKPQREDSGRAPPVLVMGHGMGAQKDIGLWVYAEKFVEAGLAVLVFDYSTFGGSAGTPRHWVSPRRHLRDWAAVVQHVKETNLGGAVDGSRIALWGVSYGGGHVLVTAARFGSDVAAVVANEPYVSPEAVLSTVRLRGLGRTLRLLALGVSDELRRLLGRFVRLEPIYLRLVAPLSDPNAVALLPLQDSEMSIRSQNAPPRRQGGWQNKVLARVVLEALGYDPSKHLAAVKAPIFFRIALKDHLCPPHVVRAALQRAALPPDQYVIQERDVTHLGAHSTGAKDEEIRPAIAFLRRHLGLGEDDAAGEPALSREGAEALAEVQFPADS